MYPGVIVRSQATLDFILVQTENRVGCIGSRALSHDMGQGCGDGPYRQEGGWLTSPDPSGSGYSTHARWVGE